MTVGFIFTSENCILLSCTLGCHLTLQKIAIWLSKKCQKLDIFFQKIAKNFLFFFKKIANGNFFWKKWKFLAIFLEKMSSFWQFFDSQMAIFRRVRYRSTGRCIIPPILSCIKTKKWLIFCRKCLEEFTENVKNIEIRLRWTLDWLSNTDLVVCVESCAEGRLLLAWL